jgi:RNA polymerase-binding transcription factor DksA
MFAFQSAARGPDTIEDVHRPVLAASVGGVSEPPNSAPVEHGADRSDDKLDLDAVERDLNDVETALGRLDDGTYWTDEVSGEEIPDEALAENPAARRA